MCGCVSCIVCVCVSKGNGIQTAERSFSSTRSRWIFRVNDEVSNDWIAAAAKCKLSRADDFLVIKKQHGQKFTNEKPRAGVKKMDYRYLHFFRPDGDDKPWVAGAGTCGILVIICSVMHTAHPPKICRRLHELP